MTNIDLEKFIVSLYTELESINEQVVTVAIDNALESMGLVIVGNHITKATVDTVNVREKAAVPEINFGEKDGLNEFEQVVHRMFEDEWESPFPKERSVKYASMLMDAARKQLESEKRLGITKKEFQEQLELLYKYADDVQYQRGYEKAIDNACDWLRKRCDTTLMEPMSVFIEDFRRELKKGL